jgi:site-specific DNA recombinase
MLSPGHPLVVPTSPLPKTLYAAIYDRVSDDRKNDQRSVQRQHRKNQEACKANGWIDRDYTDNDKGASRFSKAIRKDWDRLVADITTGRVHVVILWESSRGDRKLAEWAQFLDLCRMFGILIHITSRSRTYDVRNNPEDWKQLAQDGVDSAAETDKLSERILSGVLEVAIVGEPTNSAPYGYYREHHRRTKKLIGQFPDPDTAPIVYGIFRRVAAGVPLAAVARELNAAEVPSPGGKTWSSVGVRKVATRRAYIAEREYLGNVYRVDCKPLVGQELFWTVQRILTDPRRNPHTKGNTKPGKAAHLLGYIALCAECKGVLCAQMRGDVRKYRCKAKTCVVVTADELDEYVTDLVIARLTGTDLFERMHASEDETITVARAEVARLGAEISKALDLLKAGVYSQDEYVAISGDFKAKQAKAQEAATIAAVPASLRTLLTQDDRHRDMAERFGLLHISAQREVIRTLLTIEVRKGKRGGVKAGEERPPVEARVDHEWNDLRAAA